MMDGGKESDLTISIKLYPNANGLTLRKAKVIPKPRIVQEKVRLHKATNV